MEWYFEDEKEVQRLREVLEDWIGTPFRHHCGVKKYGTDCIHMVVAVFQELGISGFENSLLPDYPPDWFLHQSEELLVNGAEKHPRLKRMPHGTKLMNGDILFFKYGRASSHSAIYCDGRFYQAMNSLKVSKLSISDPQMKRLTYIYRLLK